MEILWERVNHSDFTKIGKRALFLTIISSLYTFSGLLVWLLVGHYFLPGKYWLICFMGYPGIFAGFFGGIIYLFNHEF